LRGGYLIEAVLLLTVLTAVLMVKPSFSSPNAVEIVNVDVGRNYYGQWWHMNSYALTTYVDTSVELRNTLNVSLAVRISSSIADDGDNIIGSQQRSQNLTANSDQTFTIGLTKIPQWARIGFGKVYITILDTNGIPLCPEATASFAIVPPFYRSITLNSLALSGEMLPNVKFWIDEAPAFSGSSQLLIQGGHIIKATSSFYGLDSSGMICLFTFKNWEDGSTGAYRLVDTRSNMTATAYYNQIRIHIQPLEKRAS
jgi:hypothetical protein